MARLVPFAAVAALLTLIVLVPPPAAAICGSGGAPGNVGGVPLGSNPPSNGNLQTCEFFANYFIVNPQLAYVHAFTGETITQPSFGLSPFWITLPSATCNGGLCADLTVNYEACVLYAPTGRAVPCSEVYAGVAAGELVALEANEQAYAQQCTNPLGCPVVIMAIVLLA